ncbi:hypothetical protein GCM10011418_25000 [Sphingobacterium alkalisoli]|nr:hypothetical protein GCM10011418_25000 [Sphingobacterium alkalisoli]
MVSAQEIITLNTEHLSISMKVKNLGYTADILTTNDHVSDLYVVSYTVEFTFKCGGTKSYSAKDISISPGKTNSEGGYTIAIPEVKGCKNGVQSARLTSFSAKTRQSSAQASNTAQQQSTISQKEEATNPTTQTVTADPRPAANASVQELAAWQRRQEAAKQASVPTTGTSFGNTEPVKTNNTANGSAEADRQRKQAELDQVLRNLEANQTRMAEERQQTEEVAGAITDYVMDLIQSEQQRKSEEREKNRLRNLANSEKATVLMNMYYNDAINKGDEFAIEQVHRAYLLWGQYEEANKFIEDMFSTYRSKYALNIKMQKELQVMNEELYSRKKYVRRAWLHPVVGTGIFYGAWKLGEIIDEDAELGDATPGVWVQTAGVLAGIYFVGSGAINLIWSFQYGKGSSEYKEAELRYNTLKKLSVQVHPSYDPWAKAPLLGLRIKF